MSATADVNTPHATSSLDNGGQPGPETETSRPGRNGASHAQIARRLLDRPLPPGYREEWTRLFARPASEEVDHDALTSVLIFRLGTEWLGLPAASCQEIAEPRPIHSLPHRRSGAVRGIVNVRGELLVCVSLSELLGIDTEAAPRAGERITAFRRLVVIGTAGGRSAFEVDEVHGLHTFDRHGLGAVPATIGRAAASVVTSVLPWNDRAVGCLDETRLTELIDRSIA